MVVEVTIIKLTCRYTAMFFKFIVAQSRDQVKLAWSFYVCKDFYLQIKRNNSLT